MVQKRIADKKSSRKLSSALTPEDRENQLIALAVNLAEEQLRNGTASAQVITHYLKLGSTRERMEKELLDRQTKLVTAKTEAYQTASRQEELYEQALKAMQSYTGQSDEND